MHNKKKHEGTRRDMSWFPNSIIMYIEDSERLRPIKEIRQDCEIQGHMKNSSDPNISNNITN